MRIHILLIFSAILFGCDASGRAMPSMALPIRANIAEPLENSHLQMEILQEIAQKIPFLNYSKLPEPVGYVWSGIDNLQLVSAGLREEFKTHAKKFKNDLTIEILPIKTCRYKVCPDNYRFSQRYKKYLYIEPTHLLLYKFSDGQVISLKMIYNTYDDLFHIFGYVTGDISSRYEAI